MTVSQSAAPARPAAMPPAVVGAVPAIITKEYAAKLLAGYSAPAWPATLRALPMAEVDARFTELARVAVESGRLSLDANQLTGLNFAQSQLLVQKSALLLASAQAQAAKLQQPIQTAAKTLRIERGLFNHEPVIRRYHDAAAQIGVSLSSTVERPEVGGSTHGIEALWTREIYFYVSGPVEAVNRFIDWHNGKRTSASLIK